MVGRSGRVAIVSVATRTKFTDATYVVGMRYRMTITRTGRAAYKKYRHKHGEKLPCAGNLCRPPFLGLVPSANRPRVFRRIVS